MKRNPRAAEQPERSRTSNQHEDPLLTWSRSSWIRAYGHVDERNMSLFHGREKAGLIIEPCERFPVYCRACCNKQLSIALLAAVHYTAFQTIFEYRLLKGNYYLRSFSGRMTTRVGKSAMESLASAMESLRKTFHCTDFLSSL